MNDGLHMLWIGFCFGIGFGIAQAIVSWVLGGIAAARSKNA